MTALVLYVMATGGLVADIEPPGKEDRQVVAAEMHEPTPPEVPVERSPRLWLLHALKLRRHGYYHEAQQAGHAAIQVILNNGLASRPDTPRYYAAQANFESDMYNFEEAAKCLIGALCHHIVHKKPQSSLSPAETLGLLGNLATTLKRMGQYEGARQVYERKLSHRLDELTAVDRAALLVSRANLLVELKEFEAARDALQKAHAILATDVPKDSGYHPSYLLAKGKLHVATGEAEEAQVCLLAAVDGTERIYGTHTLPFIKTVVELAEFQMSEGKSEAAAKLLSRVKIIDEARQYGGPDHPLLVRLRATESAAVGGR